MKELLCMAISEAELKLMETEAVVRAGASLMPSPMKAMIAFWFSAVVGAFLERFCGTSRLSQDDELLRRGALFCSQRILSAFWVGRTPAKTWS